MLADGFVGIGLLGLGGSANLAAVCNLVCGTAVVLLFRRATSMGTDPGLVGDPASIPVASASTARSGTAAVVLIAAGLAGASALAAEILWTRMLLPYLSSSSYAFSVVMASYLLGISLATVRGAALPNAVSLIAAHRRRFVVTASPDLRGGGGEDKRPHRRALTSHQ